MSAPLPTLRDTAEPTDEELFRRFRDVHDDRAFATLVYRHERPLFAYLRRLVHSEQLAEDIFQSTFLRIHTKRQSFDVTRRFQPWLYTVATRQAIDTIRREKRHRRYPAPSAAFAEVMLEDMAASDCTPVEQVVEREERQRVRVAVGRLSAVQQRAVQLIYGEGLAYREAAGVLGVPIGTVKSRVHSAILALGGSWA
jgi:RNA polymerase sigma-70 factor (ECF subfamily)